MADIERPHSILPLGWLLYAILGVPLMWWVTTATSSKWWTLIYGVAAGWGLGLGFMRVLGWVRHRRAYS
jgi:hypothetical protein